MCYLDNNGIEHRGPVFVLAICLVMFGITTAQASHRIPAAYIEIARAYKIPATVLYAVALAESGLQIKKGKYRPWPWTLNVAGKSKRYATRIQAYEAIKRYLGQGIRSIDIGLLQVNWYWNSDKLDNDPWKALDPVFNASTGAKILKASYLVKGNWPLAIGHYHSPGTKTRQRRNALKYALRVIKHHQRIAGIEQ